MSKKYLVPRHTLSSTEAAKLRAFILRKTGQKTLKSTIVPSRFPEESKRKMGALPGCLDVDYRHLVGVLTCQRVFAVSLERSLADGLGVTANELRAAVHYDPPDGGLYEVNSVDDHEKRARDRSNRGHHVDSIDDALLVERYHVNNTDWLKASKWATHQGLEYRFMSKHDEALECFERAHRHLRQTSEAEKADWEAICLDHRVSKYRIWVDLQLRKAQLTRARAEYCDLLASLERRGRLLSRKGSITQSDVEIEKSGLRWRIAEVDVIQGDYQRAHLEFSSLHKEACKNYDADHAVWSLFGVARAEIMLGKYKEAKDRLHRVIWAATRTAMVRNRLYGEMAILQLCLACKLQREYTDSRATFEQRAGVVQRVRRGIYSSLLEALWYLVFEPVPLSRVKALCNDAVTQSEKIPLHREEAMARLMRGVALVAAEKWKAAQADIVLAYESFKVMKCNWGIIRCEVLLRQYLKYPVTPFRTRYQGVDLALKKADDLSRKGGYKKRIPPAEIVRHFL